MNKRKIILTGSNGIIGKSLISGFSKRDGIEIICLDQDLGYDLTDEDQVIDIMKASQSWVIRYEEPINLPNRFILDTQINLKIWKFQTMLSVNNLLGVEYYDEKSLNEFLPGSDDGDNTNNLLLPGTWVRFGIKFPV